VARLNSEAIHACVVFAEEVQALQTQHLRGSNRRLLDRIGGPGQFASMFVEPRHRTSPIRNTADSRLGPSDIMIVRYA
jgi:hypothetical protein